MLVYTTVNLKLKIPCTKVVRTQNHGKCSVCNVTIISLVTFKNMSSTFKGEKGSKHKAINQKKELQWATSRWQWQHKLQATYKSSRSILSVTKRSPFVV